MPTESYYATLAARMVDADVAIADGLKALQEYASLPLTDKFVVIAELDRIKRERRAAAEQQRQDDLDALKEGG
jgi:hypothetical protein